MLENLAEPFVFFYYIDSGRIDLLHYKKTPMSEKKLFLLDGHALVYRAHYAFINRPLINSKGINTSAITGFTRFLWDILKNEQPTHLAVAFDPSGPVFRNEMFDAYKANREAQPQDISIALPYIESIVRGFNIPIIMVQNYEADDVIGTIAKQSEKEGFKVYMVTPDKDYAQLVSPNIFLYKPSRQGNGVEILGEEEVKASWNISRVEQVIDVLALQGDSVDNIPGIPGIGGKTAVKLLEKYDTLEGLLANVSSLSGKQRENVEHFAEQGKMSKILATIDLNVPIQFNENEFAVKPINKPVLSEIFKELEFRTLARQILEEQGEGTSSINSNNSQGKQGNLFEQNNDSNAEEPAFTHSIAENNAQNTPHEYVLVEDTKDLESLRTELAKQSIFCFDTETTDVDPNVAELVGMSFCMEPKKSYYIPVPADKGKTQAILELFRPIFENEKISKIGQNIKYDAIILKWYGVDLKGIYLDTMICHYLLEPEMRKHNMDFLAETYLNYKPISIEELIGKKGKTQMTMRDVPVEEVKEYAAEDADITLQLWKLFEPELKSKTLDKVYFDIEEPLVKVLVEMEYEGINLDKLFLNQYSVELGQQIEELEMKIYETAGTKFNIAAPNQVGEILFDKMQIPYKWKKTKTGQYSTNEEKLSELASENPFVNDILKFRGLSKLKSTYVDTLPNMLNPKTGRIHSSFNQALAATGRLSSNNPNLQNIPVRTPEGAKIREAFIARDNNHILLSADYSQIELRLIAHISGDEAMIEAFNANQDIHTATAAKVFEVPFEEVTKDQRYKAKTVNFSIIYGAGATNLSRQLNIKRNEAKDIIDQYFRQYNGLKNYMYDIVEFARKNGYVSTVLGRKRMIRDINSNSSLERSNAERIAINSPIQGTAADLIKIAMVNIHRAFGEMGLRTKMVLQVHDELVFDVPNDELEVVKPIIEEKMKTAIPGLKIPIIVGMGVGKNWKEAH